MNYTGITRTNYFHVKDANALEDILNRAVSEDTPRLWEETADDGSTVYGFGLYDDIYGLEPPADLPEDADWDEDDIDAFYDELQKIVCEGDAIVIESSGYEGLRFAHAGAAIITPENISFVNFRGSVADAVHSLPGYEKYNLRDAY